MPSFSIPAVAIAGSDAAVATAAGTSLAATGAATGAAAASSAGLFSSLATAGSLLGGISSAVGSMTSGAANKQAAEYQSQVAQNNAKLAEQNQQWSTEAGEAATAQQQQKTRAEVGGIKAAQAASGVDVNSGSAVDVRSSAAELGELDAMTIRSNATKQAYGYGTQAQGFNQQSTLDQLTAKNSGVAGDIGAGTSLLSGATGAASNYAKWQSAGGSSMSFF